MTRTNPSRFPGGMRYEHGKVVPHLTVEERVARGKAARREVPRSSHAGFTPGEHRPDPVALLEQQAVTRVPELVPIRYGRMLVSPFTFYRGAALIMAADLAGTPRSGITTQVCGDAHLMNFGVFASPERRLEFGINDFDETCPGPWEWDVKRLAASFAIAGRDNGFSTKERARVLLALLGEYRSAMHRVRGDDQPGRVVLPHRRRGRHQGAAEPASAPAARKRAEANVAKARTRDSLQAFDKLTRVVDGQRRIISDPPLIQPIEELFEGMERDQIHEFAAGGDPQLPPDVAERPPPPARGLPRGRRGPQGRRCRQRRHPGVDRADARPRRHRPAVPASQGGRRPRCSRSSSGAATADPMANGWCTASTSCRPAATSSSAGTTSRVIDGVERDFYVRQLRDWKGAALVETMNPATMAIYARLCAGALVRAHARSGDRIAIASYLGSSDAFDRALAEFSEAYADQNERDYDALVQAEKDGRITAQRGI